MGSGSGWEYSLLRTLGLDVVSIDVRPDAPTQVFADATLLPFRSSQFDGVVCLRTLHHIPNAGGALSEFARVLRPGGFIFLAVTNLWSYTMASARISSSRWTSNPNDPFYHPYTVHRLRTLLAKNGFGSVRTKSCHYLPRILATPSATGLTRLVMSADSTLGNRFPTSALGPILLAYGRRR